MSILPSELQSPATETTGFTRTAILEESIQIRVPTFTADDGVGYRISKLEEWVLGTAAVAGGLSAERLRLHEELSGAGEEWESIWVNGKTTALMDKERAETDPDLARRRRELKWLIARLDEEIDRFEREYAKVSRVYTMMSGS